MNFKHETYLGTLLLYSFNMYCIIYLGGIPISSDLLRLHLVGSNVIKPMSSVPTPIILMAQGEVWGRL